ncbi:MAG: hypothetical protein KatS3mg118_2613 [Paracoccaceae bacterium]|nr:MAG: hypothetical protein KatS3mg118_2613 [Paracoccaceae bacterium]
MARACYGLSTFGDLFTDRQLVALNTFSDLVHEAREEIEKDALAAGLSPDPTPLREGGTGARAYAEAVSVYLGFAMDASSPMLGTHVTGATREACAHHVCAASHSHGLGFSQS